MLIANWGLTRDCREFGQAIFLEMLHRFICCGCAVANMVEIGCSQLIRVAGFFSGRLALLVLAALFLFDRHQPEAGQSREFGRLRLRLLLLYRIFFAVGCQITGGLAGK